ncbi:hypothetical protein [Minwuia sp.]|uniref:hypothetical protein n=1 Tax=Minwuia sp. TaxID=2493630 RepID=UPI003A8D296B
MLSQLLLVGAILAFVLTALTGDDIWAPKFTRWDETAVLLALAMLSGMLVDHEAARTAAENLSVELVGTGDDVLRSPQVSMDPA